MKEVYWCTVNGVVGTAHDNRDGKRVDFRPAKKTYGYLGNIEVRPKIVTTYSPAKGVLADDLVAKGKITAVDYNARTAYATATEFASDTEWCFPMDESPSLTCTLIAYQEVDGFPVPTEIKEKWEAERAKYAKERLEWLASRAPFQPTVDGLIEWASKLPRQQARWMRRRVLYGTNEQILNVIYSTFPDITSTTIDAAVDEMRRRGTYQE